MKKITALFLLGLAFFPAAAQSDKVRSPAAPSPTEKIPIRTIKSGKDYITLNFSNIEVSALVKVMSELTRKNFILDERVKGKVTLMTPTKISPTEAYQVFLSALEIKGFTAVEDGRVIRIIPTSFARQSGLKVMTDAALAGEGFVTRLIRLSYVDPQEISRTLSPLMSKNGNLIAYSATNSLIVTDSVHNIKKIESLVRALDVATPEGKGKINVYYLKNGNAEDIGKVLSSLVSKMPRRPARRPARAGQRRPAAPAGPATILEGAVTITSDKATNSLIIVASPIDYETMRDVIRKLDIRRRQVYVEAAIIEMGLAKQRELGFEFQAVNPIKDNPNELTTAGGTNFGNIGNVIAGGPAGLSDLTGLTIGAVKGTFEFNGVTFLNVGALLRALQTDGDVNVLSTPNILTTDNEEAEIMVGENIPFITGQTQSTATGAGSILSTIDRQDVGITLKLTPQITSDDNVRLVIYQEISSVTVTPGLDPNVVGPSTSKRSASTTVVIKDRETMVIGGLIRDNVITSTSKVPLLGDIPLLGWFFRSKTTKVEKTNLMLFITPYIIKTAEEAAEITRRKGQVLDEFRREYRIKKKKAGPEIPAESSEKPGAGEEPAADAAGKTETDPAGKPKPDGKEQTGTKAQPFPTGKPSEVPAEDSR
ncbi:MAG TPA: type II secretion system protein GspD [Nitrospiraceae bacterium]|nr:type II secretion system protein GspD [Nitrospiraceae bacterium]